MPDRPPDDPRSLVGRLYDVHGAALYQYALMLLADPAAAEDAVQQVFSSSEFQAAVAGGQKYRRIRGADVGVMVLVRN